MNRPHTILERYLSNAVVRGERMVAISRLVLCSLFLVQWILFNGVLAPVYGTKHFWLGIAGFILGGVYSSWVLKWFHTPRHLRVNLVASVSVDAVIIGLVIVPQVLWFRPDRPGILESPDLAILMMATVAAGIRLSRSTLLIGAGLMLVLFAATVGMEYAMRADAMYAGPVVTWGVFLFGSVVLGYSVATRTRRLVFQGADAALIAERTRQRFGAYVSEEVAQEAIDAEEITLGGRRQPVAVLFSDLRGFTAYAEHVPPERLVGELNAYLDVMVEAVKREGGMVDKFIGDAIMVVFGVPVPRPDDARRAVRAARAMQEALSVHNAERERAGKPAFLQGIGVHYGPAVAGHIGNAERLQFTVIGDVVNVASRLESATKAQKVSVLVSAAVAEAARAASGDRELPPLESLGSIDLPGHEQELEVYTLT